MAVRHIVLLGLLLLSVGALAPSVAADPLASLPDEGYPHCLNFLAEPHHCLCPWPQPADNLLCPIPGP